MTLVETPIQGRPGRPIYEQPVLAQNRAGSVQRQADPRNRDELEVNSSLTNHRITDPVLCFRCDIAPKFTEFHSSLSVITVQVIGFQ